MGQGTDSCGGWEIEYDAYEEGLESGFWTTKDHQSIHISSMSVRHLRNARQVALRAASRATFSCDSEKWEEWADLLGDEISSRQKEKEKEKEKNPNVTPSRRRNMVDMKCHCGNVYQTYESNLKRGWGKSCSKSCAAIRRDFGRPSAVRI